MIGAIINIGWHRNDRRKKEEAVLCGKSNNLQVRTQFQPSISYRR